MGFASWFSNIALFLSVFTLDLYPACGTIILRASKKIYSLRNRVVMAVVFMPLPSGQLDNLSREPLNVK